MTWAQNLEGDNMKIAISAVEGKIDTRVDARFGRAAWFLIIESDSGKLIEAIDNSAGKDVAHGAGIAAAALVADKGVQAVLTGRVGPKALPVLQKANVQIVNDVSGTVTEAVSAFASGSGMRSVDSENLNSSGGGGPGRGMGQGKCTGQGKGMGQGRGQCRR